MATIVLPNAQITIELVLLTPELAAAWLSESNIGNRPIGRQHVDRLARDIVSDRYQVSHQGIAFDTSGQMFDGQHRCEAVVKSGTPILVLVFRGLPPSVREVVDAHRLRGVLDTLHWRGSVADGSYVAVARAMLRFSKGHTKTTRGEAADFVQKHEEAIAFALSILPAKKASFSRPIIAGVLARASYRHDRHDLTRFARVLCDGFSEEPRDRSVIHLRNSMLSVNAEKSSTRDDSYRRAEVALKAYLDGKALGILRADHWRGELFPIPE